MKTFTTVVVSMAMLAQTQGASLRKLQDDWTLNGDDINDMLNRINSFRADNGLGGLSLDDRIMGAAQEYANEMAYNCHFDHTGVDGSSVADRLARWGLEGAIGENIAAGQQSVGDVMDSWINSDGHRENLLGDYNLVGFARQINGGCGDYALYWAQDFSS